MIYIILLLVAAVYIIYSQVVKKRDKDEEDEILEKAKVYYSIVENDMENAVETVAIDVDFLSTSGKMRTVKSQNTSPVFVKNKRAFYAFEVTLKNHRNLDKDDVDDFKSRLERALVSMHQNRECKTPFRLDVADVKRQVNYIEIIVTPRMKVK